MAFGFPPSFPNLGGFAPGGLDATGAGLPPQVGGLPGGLSLGSMRCAACSAGAMSPELGLVMQNQQMMLQLMQTMLLLLVSLLANQNGRGAGGAGGGPGGLQGVGGGASGGGGGASATGGGGGGAGAASGTDGSGSGGSANVGPKTGKLVDIPGGKVDSSIADNVKAMMAAAKKDGVELKVSSSYRSRAEQERLYAAYKNGTGNLAAKPGTSNHESGLAIDFANTPGAYDWLKKNAGRFGLKNLPSEPWHYSTDGR